MTGIWQRLSALILFSVASVRAECFDSSPAFPVASWPGGGVVLSSAVEAIEAELTQVVSRKKYDASSFSIELTSNTETIWSHFHTARTRNESRPGTEQVDSDSIYRIASISKTFTVLGLLYQHEAGNLSLDDPINKYVSGLEGDLPWKDITLRILASQLSGLPREFAQSDMINEFQDPTSIGLPPATKDGVPRCDEYNHYVPCNASDLLKALKGFQPLYAPNQKSTYSNINFSLLGLALENVTGLDYETYMKEAIFDPLKMESTTFSTPSDEHAVLPVLKNENNYWDVDAGIQNPTGGIYSTSSDMSKYLRYIMTHYNTIATGVNWLMPASWSDGSRSFYGMPWEIFRTEKALESSNRAVTFVTKSGGLPGYYSKISLMPEYGLGLTVLVGGKASLLEEIQEIVTIGLVRAAESLVWEDMKTMYDGLYIATDDTLNSSITLSSSPADGLTVVEFISNGTDVLHNIIKHYLTDDDDDDDADDDEPTDWRAQLVPTLLYKDEDNQKGEIWRLITVPGAKSDDGRKVWDDFCSTDVDTARYAGIPANEIVFWHDEKTVELPAWKVKMKITEEQENDRESEKLIVQS